MEKRTGLKNTWTISTCFKIQATLEYFLRIDGLVQPLEQNKVIQTGMDVIDSGHIAWAKPAYPDTSRCVMVCPLSNCFDMRWPQKLLNTLTYPESWRFPKPMVYDKTSTRFY